MEREIWLGKREGEVRMSHQSGRMVLLQGGVWLVVGLHLVLQFLQSKQKTEEKRESRNNGDEGAGYAAHFGGGGCDVLPFV